MSLTSKSRYRKFFSNPFKSQVVLEDVAEVEEVEEVSAAIPPIPAELLQTFKSRLRRVPKHNGSLRDIAESKEEEEDPVVRLSLIHI